MKTRIPPRKHTIRHDLSEPVTCEALFIAAAGLSVAIVATQSDLDSEERQAIFDDVYEMMRSAWVKEEVEDSTSSEIRIVSGKKLGL